jgi:hypothetical protein
MNRALVLLVKKVSKEVIQRIYRIFIDSLQYNNNIKIRRLNLYIVNLWLIITIAKD